MRVVSNEKYFQIFLLRNNSSVYFRGRVHLDPKRNFELSAGDKNFFQLSKNVGKWIVIFGVVFERASVPPFSCLVLNAPVSTAQKKWNKVASEFSLLKNINRQVDGHHQKHFSRDKFRRARAGKIWGKLLHVVNTDLFLAWAVGRTEHGVQPSVYHASCTPCHHHVLFKKCILSQG